MYQYLEWPTSQSCGGNEHRERGQSYGVFLAKSPREIQINLFLIIWQINQNLNNQSKMHKLRIISFDKACKIVHSEDWWTRIGLGANSETFYSMILSQPCGASFGELLYHTRKISSFIGGFYIWLVLDSIKIWSKKNNLEEHWYKYSSKTGPIKFTKYGNLPAETFLHRIGFYQCNLACLYACDWIQGGVNTWRELPILYWLFSSSNMSTNGAFIMP